MAIPTVKFNKNGKLKVMHITDTHLEHDNIDMSLFLIDWACKKEKPDVAVITGDNVQNYDDARITQKYIDRLMSIFDNQQIPVAVTFGNHDSEVGALSRQELMEHYNTHPFSVSHGDGPDCGTYCVPVYSEDGKQVKFNLWVFDSNDYDEKGRYACVLPNQIEWYKKKSDEITATNGKKIYAFAFQHMIVDDVYDALKKADKKRFYSFAHMYNKTDYYMFDPEATNFGTLNETPCSGYHNYGQFDAMVEKGDVLAVFSGHDHTNAFGVKHKGIDIVNSLSTRYNGDRFSSQYGYRILEVPADNTSHYTSRNERWYNMFTQKDIKDINASGNTLGIKTATSVTRKGRLQRFYTKFGRAFVKLVTGRRVSYPHY